MLKILLEGQLCSLWKFRNLNIYEFSNIKEKIITFRKLPKKRCDVPTHAMRLNREQFKLFSDLYFYEYGRMAAAAILRYEKAEKDTAAAACIHKPLTLSSLFL